MYIVVLLFLLLQKEQNNVKLKQCSQTIDASYTYVRCLHNVRVGMATVNHILDPSFPRHFQHRRPEMATAATRPTMKQRMMMMMRVTVLSSGIGQFRTVRGVGVEGVEVGVGARGAGRPAAPGVAW